MSKGYYKTRCVLGTMYVLVTGSATNNQKIEVIYGNGTTKICQDKVNYPSNVYQASGSLLFNIYSTAVGLLICGGELPVNSDCYSMSSNDKHWISYAKMKTMRTSSASVAIHDHVWITGSFLISLWISIYQISSAWLESRVHKQG